MNGLYIDVQVFLMLPFFINKNQSHSLKELETFIYSAQVIGKYFLFTKIGTHVHL